MSKNEDRNSTRLNSSHTEIYTLSLHDALPILERRRTAFRDKVQQLRNTYHRDEDKRRDEFLDEQKRRSEQHTSELQSHRDLHSFPTRRSSDLGKTPHGFSR